MGRSDIVVDLHTIVFCGIAMTGLLLAKIIGIIRSGKSVADMVRDVDSAAQQDKQINADQNAQEAKHSSWFVAGHRPYASWVCGTMELTYPLWFIFADFATLELMTRYMMTVILPIHVSLLGLRSYDKQKGTDTRALGKKIGAKIGARLLNKFIK